MLSNLFLLYLDGMTIGVTHHNRLLEPELYLWIRSQARRNKAHVIRDQLARSPVGISSQHDRLPVNHIVSALIGREGASITRREVFQQLDAGASCCPQCRNPQMRPKNVVQMFLFSAVIFAFPGDAHSQEVAVELEAGIGIRNHDRGVINAKKQLVGRTSTGC